MQPVETLERRLSKSFQFADETKEVLGKGREDQRKMWQLRIAAIAIGE